MNLRRVMQQSQNRSRALEVRLEEETEQKYYVVIAGMTVHNQCRGGICEPTPQGDYLYIDNETYACQSYSDIETAKRVYLDYKSSYID